MIKNKLVLIAIAFLIFLFPLASQVYGEQRSEQSNMESLEEFSVSWNSAMDLVTAMSKPSFLNAVKSAEFKGVAVQAAVFNQTIQGFPRYGSSFALISTGYASSAPGQAQTFASTNVQGGRYQSNYSPHGYDANDLAELIITVTVPSDANTLSFDYKFGTEENPDYLGSVYQDYFRILALVPDSHVCALVHLLPDGSLFVSVDNSNKYSNNPGGSSDNPLPPFPEPNDTVYNAVTNLQHVSFNVSAYQGKNMTIIIEIADASDGVFDSAVFLDAFEFSTSSSSSGFLTLPFTDPNVWVGWIFDPLIKNDFPDQPAHYGIDFILGGAQASTWKNFDVVAAAGGKAYRSTNYPGWGEYVVVEHDIKDAGGNNYYTLYSHLFMGSINPKIPLRGQGTYSVKQGDYLGRAGDTGSSGLRHLHFEVRPGNTAGKQVDPYDLFNPDTRQYNHRDSKRGTPAVQLMGGPNHLWVSNPPPVSPALVQTLKVSVQSPVSLSMQDSAGRITGVVSGQIKSEIPGSSYNPDYKEITILGAYDNYTIKVYGEDTGTYSLNALFYNESEVKWYRSDIIDKPINKGDTHEHNEIEWEEILYQSFIDVLPSHGFFHYIEAIYKAGITTGFSDGTYRPNDPVTRGQMAAFIARALGLDTSSPPATPSFPDVPSGYGFYAYIEAVYAEEITTGFSDGTYRPYEDVTRGQMAAFLARALDLDTSNPPATPSFPDVPTNHGFYKYVEAIYAEGITTGYSDGEYKPNNVVTRGQMAAFLARAFDLLD